MPVPMYYDDPSLVLKVDPDSMYVEIWGAMNMYGQGIADSINRIVDVWNSLKLGWVGTTSDEAQAFNDAWSAAITKLFGSSNDPTSGILNQMGNGVVLASINYGEAETSVTKLFRDMGAALVKEEIAAGFPSDGGGDPSRHLNDGPITENT